MGEHLGALTGNLDILFQLKGVGVVQTDLETGRLLRATQAFCEMVGYSKAELQEMTYEELTHPDDRARDAANFAAFQRGELTGSDAVTRVLRRDGAVVWLELHVSILKNAGQLYNVAVAHDVTERKRAEKAQQAADARALLALEVGRLGTWNWDPSRDEVVADARCREICGLEPQVALTLTDVAERVHPDDWQQVRAALEAALQPEGAHHYAEEFRFVHPDGAVRWVVSRGNAYVEEGGGIGLLGTVLDVTERKEAEEALRKSEAQSRTILESITDAFFALDHDWRFTYVNRQAQRLLDRPPGDLLGKVIWDSYPGLAGSEFEKVYVRASDEQVASSVTSYYPDHDRWYEVHAYPAADGITVYFRNVTERMQAEQVLRESEARYRMLFTSIDEGFCVIEMLFDEAGKSVDYRFLEANPMFEQQTGLLQVVGKTARELVPDLETYWFEMYGKVALTGEAIRFVNEAETMNRWFDVYAFRLGGQESRKVALLFTDITERRRAEEALKNFNATLERRVEARTAELRQSERRFTQAFSAGPIAACITTLGEEAFLEVNGAFARLTGYSHSEVAGKTYEQLGIWLSPEEQTKLEQARDAEGNVRNLELKLRTKSGEVKDILLSAGVIDPHGEQGHLTMFYDITRRKEAEAEREVLRQAMDNAEESVIVTTADLELPGPRITYVNAAFTAMTGYQPEEVIGQTPRMFQGPETDRAVLRRMRRRLKVGRTFQGETVNYRKDDSTYILAWNVAPIYGGQDRITHWISTQHDVTERRALERELLDISAREQRRIAGDLHDSVQQQLVGTAMHAKRLANVAKASAPGLATELEQLYTSVQDGIKSVRAVLSGITPVQETENGLLVALESMCQRVTSIFGTPCSFSFEQPLLIRDFERATQLYYIAQEAAINAAKHAEASRIDVRLAGTGGSYTLTITDDGKGVSRKKLQPQNGMGLGLMMYRAKLIGAELDLSSAPGEGTMVTCLFDT